MTRIRRLLLVAPLLAPYTAWAQSVGYNEDLKSVLDNKCQTCHASKPPALGTAAQATANATGIVDRISRSASDAKLMPPGKPLDGATIASFKAWADAGGPASRSGSSTSSTSTRPASGSLTTAPPTTRPNGTKPGNQPGNNVIPPGSNNGDPTPLVLDLGGHGDFRFAKHAVTFDIRADGAPMALRWPAAGTGFLAMDRNKNGKIDDGSELFGDARREGGTRAADGFEALRVLDSNHDGVVDRRDAAFNELVVWTDANENGVTDAGELKPLLAYGIDALALSFETIPGLGEDGRQPKLLLGSYTAHGEIHILADIFLEGF